MTKNPIISDTMAEAGIIATLIYNPSYILHSEQLKHTHFFNKESACLYWGVNHLVKQGVENIDSFNLTAIINSNEGMKNTFDKFGINLEEYITLSASIKRDTIEEYMVLVKRVLALAFKRELHKNLEKFDKDCMDVQQDDISKLSGDIYESLNKLNEKYISDGDEIKLLSDEVDSLWEEIKQDSTEGEGNYKSKIPLFNDYFDYAPSNLILVTARYKNGKSAFALNETLNLLRQGATVGYFDSELTKKEFLIRSIANLAQVKVRDIRNGSYTPSQELLLKEALSYIKNQKLIHIYDPNWTAEKIYTTAKILQYKFGMDFLVYDYLKCTNGINASDVYLKLGSLTNALKNDVAGTLKIPVLSLAQLNRQGEIGDSDQIARYASTVIYWRKKDVGEIVGDYKQVGNYKAQVKINRLGGQQEDGEGIDCVFEGDIMTIYQAPEQSSGVEL